MLQRKIRAARVTLGRGKLALPWRRSLLFCLCSHSSCSCFTEVNVICKMLTSISYIFVQENDIGVDASNSKAPKCLDATVMSETGASRRSVWPLFYLPGCLLVLNNAALRAAETVSCQAPWSIEMLRRQISELQSHGEENDWPLKRSLHHFRLRLSLKQMRVHLLVKRSMMCSQRGRKKWQRDSPL